MSLTVAKLDKKNNGWIAAAVLSLLLGALASKLAVAFGNLFLLGVIACIVSWLLAKYLESKDGIHAWGALFIGEVVVLLIGIC